MRVFVVTVAKRPPAEAAQLWPEVARRIDAALSDPVWLIRDNDRRESWISPLGLTRIDVVANEPPSTGPLIHRYPNGTAATWTGHIDDPSFVADHPDPDRVARLPGAFALALASDDGADGFTCVHRTEPLYVAEGPDVRVLSSSAKVAHAVAGIPDREPPYDAVLGLCGAGRMINDVTPYPGVTAVPRDTHVALRLTGMTEKRLPAPDIDPAAPVEEYADIFIEALLTAVRAAGREGPVVADLTGGKDSRLVAVALAAAGVDFTTVTRGHDAHPDVILAKRVAAVLGVPHQSNSPATPAGVVEARPANRAYHTLRGCEGMISCYDTVNVLATFRVGQTRVGGHIGEALRGGSQFGLGAGSTAVVRARMMDRLAPHYMLLTPPAKARVDEIVAPHDEMLKVDGHRSGEEVFLSLGAGRWHAVKRAAYSIGGPRREILADNQLSRIAAAANQEAVAHDRLIHAAMHRLRPELCTIPFYGHRWEFEAKGPSPYCDPEHWEERAAIPYRGGGAWEWRDQYPVELHRYFIESILSAPRLFDDLLDRAQTEEFLWGGEYPNRSYLHVRLTWAMYTASQLLHGLGSEPSVPDGPLFTIPIPQAVQDEAVHTPKPVVRVDGADYRQCNLCDTVIATAEIPEGGRCPSCGAGPEHRGLRHVLDNYGDVLHGRAVLAIGAADSVPRDFFAAAADVTLVDRAGEAADEETVLRDIPASTQDAVVVLPSAEPAPSARLVEQAARVLRTGGVLVGVAPAAPAKDGEATTPPLAQLAASAGLTVTVLPGLDPVLRRAPLVVLAYQAAEHQVPAYQAGQR